jgi:hypothetical protein
MRSFDTLETRRAEPPPVWQLPAADCPTTASLSLQGGWGGAPGYPGLTGVLTVKEPVS